MFRIEPKMAAHNYKTYSIAAPVQSHFRDGTCEEAACPNWAHGWTTTVDERLDLGQMQAHYIRTDSGRRYSEERNEHGQTCFTFAAGQTCFTRHQLPLERPALYVVRGGDWRGNPRGEFTRHSGPEPWLDDFSEHQQRLADEIDKG